MKFLIHWVCNAPSPYNDFLFQTLAADPEINITVHFRKDRLSSHLWTVPMAKGFPCRYFKEFFGVDWRLINLATKNKESLFVLGGWNHITALALFSILLIRDCPFIIWTDTPNIYKYRNCLKERLRANYLKVLFRHAIAVLATGVPGCKAVEKMGCPKEKIVNFPYWTPLPDASEFRATDPEDRIIFFSVGRLDKIKGYHDAIEAFARVNAFQDQGRLEYWIFGEGPERGRLEGLAGERGLGDIVKFQGWLDPVQLRQRIAGGHVLVHPALWEPHGVAVLEAMALGKPVIASDRTMAAVDRVRHGVNGFIHETGNIQQIAEHMGLFIRNPGLIHEMGREARLTAEEWPVQRGLEIIKRIVRKNLH